MKNYKIAVAGTGYVGLSIATLLSQHHQVTAVDIVPEKVEMINNHKSPIQDDYIEKYLAEKKLNLTATLDAKAAYSDADFVVIATLALVELAVGVILYIQIMSRGHEYYNKKYWKYALLINLPLVPHFLSQVILNHSDRIMIQKMVGESAAGVYSLAYSMAMILSMINTSILQAIRPWVFQRIKAGEKEKIQPVVVSAILVVAFCNIMLISFAPELVAIFAPGSYSGAIDLMPPITLAVLFAFLYNLFVDIEMYFEKTKSVMNIAIVCAAINLITNYFGIMWFGYAAVAYTTLACYILMAILHYCSMERMLRKNNIKGKIYDAKIIVAISLAYVLIGTVMGVLSGHLFLRLIVMAILAVVLYLNRSRFTQIFVLIKNKRH